MKRRPDSPLPPSTCAGSDTDPHTGRPCSLRPSTTIQSQGEMGKTRRIVAEIVLGCSLVAAGTLPSDREANASPPVGPAGSHGAPKKGACPLFRVCLWTANDFNGTRGVFRPVPPGQCRKIGDLATHAWSSAVNNTLVPVRLWQVAENTKAGARCGVERFRRNGIVRPFRAVRQFSFHTAEGLGGV